MFRRQWYEAWERRNLCILFALRAMSGLRRLGLVRLSYNWPQWGAEKHPRASAISESVQTLARLY